MPDLSVHTFVLASLLPAFSLPQGPCKLITKTQSTALCINHGLRSVPNNLPQHIEEFVLDQNPIRKLQNGSLSRYTSVRLLSCAACQLSAVEDLAFLRLSLLENLNLAKNELYSGYKDLAKSLNFLTRIRILDLSGNGLTEDMVSELLKNLTSLEILNLSQNVLLRLDEQTFRDLHQLKELNLERNYLFEIDDAFDHLKKLTRLNLAFNSLPCLIKFEMTQLVVLNASHNAIEWFITNQNLMETFELETLDLSDNQLLYFPFLPISSHIKTLLLSNNHINFYSHLSQTTSLNWTTSVVFYNLGRNIINITAKLWDDDLHGDINSVELLDLSVNQVRYFPQGFLQKMPHLYWLKLRSNCLESLNLTGDNFPATLFELDVSNNRITELYAEPGSVVELNNLTHLNLSLNDIQKLPPRVFSSFPSLSIMDLSHNTVDLCHLPNPEISNFSTCAVLSNLSSLKQLHLIGCNIGSVPPFVFDGTPLTHLDLSNNPHLLLSHDCLLSLSGTLQHLGLSNTGLKEFNFSPYKHLKFLNISKNSISKLPKSISSLNLKLLDLRYNLLSAIEPEQAVVLTEHIETIYLSGNSFNCCQLEWFKTFEESKTFHVADRSQMTCIDLHKRTQVELFNRFFCDGSNTEESIFWYILLFTSVSISIVGICVIYVLTFKPRLLPLVIKKKWKPTTY